MIQGAKVGKHPRFDTNIEDLRPLTDVEWLILKMMSRQPHLFTWFRAAEHRVIPNTREHAREKGLFLSMMA